MASGDQRDDECGAWAPSLSHGFVRDNSQCIREPAQVCICAGEKARLQARDAVQRPHIHLRLPVHGHHEPRSLHGCMRVDL